MCRFCLTSGGNFAILPHRELIAGHNCPSGADAMPAAAQIPADQGFSPPSASFSPRGKTMNDNAAQAVLEAVLRLAMDEALALHAKEGLEDEGHGALTAYFSLLELGKQQAAIAGLRFEDPELDAFDPYALLAKD
jgi:hypothetical protein